MFGRTMKVCALGCLVAMVSPASAQVGRTNVGAALDANYQVGSGGVNYQPLRRDYRINSQLFVTGQVTGLNAFRGGVDYFAANELNIENLPSASLRTFRRQSVSVQDAIRGENFQAAPFYDPAQTVLRAPEITGGFTEPGTNVPRRGRVQRDFTGQLYSDALTDYEPLFRQQLPGRLLTEPIEVAPTGRGLPAGGTEGPVRISRPGSNALFGLPRHEQRRELAEELAAVEVREDRIEAGVDARLDAEVQARQDASLREVPGQQDEPDADEREALPADLAAEQDRPAAARRRPEDGLWPEPGQDVILDVLRYLNEPDQAGLVEGEAPFEEEPMQPGEPFLPGGQDPSAEEDGPPVESRRGHVIIRSMAGRAEDLFNGFMRAGETALREGQFYKAAQEYEKALAVEPRNPLARVGVALASFGGGEYLAAGMNVRRALSAFPALMETHVDVPRMLGADVLESRLSRLEERITRATREMPLLRTAAVFICANSGRQEDARTHAEILKRITENDALLQAYAEFVLTGRRPAEAARGE